MTAQQQPMTPQQKAAADKFDRHMVEATGHVFSDYVQVRDAGPTALAHIQLYGRVVDESGVVALLEQWANEERKGPVGRKALISHRAALILYLMHMDAGSVRYDDIARTLSARLTPAAYEYLGIENVLGDREHWYHRYWRALNRILRLTSPWELPRNAFLSAVGYQRALESYSQERRDRMDQLMNGLIHAAVRRLPADIRATYRGNVAIDATLLEVAGRPNPGRQYDHEDRRNLDAMSGPYRKRGKHEGNGGKKNTPGWEAETVVTLPNAPKAPDSFPILTTGVTLHQPGRIKHGPRIAIDFHASLFDERGYLMADRAYNGLQPHRFQNPVRKLGFRGVYKYKNRLTGKQGAIGDVILVDGHLYVKWMPAELVTATHDFKYKKSIDRDTYEMRLARRSAYALKDKGRPDRDGFQRFSFPDVTRIMCIDPTTGKRVRPVLESKTFTLGPTDDASMNVIKHLQGFEYRTEQWYSWHGLRSHVESNNKYLKDDAYTDLGNPSKRRPRGYAYQALAFAAAATVSNIRRIVTFVTNVAKKTLTKAQLRTRRRTDEHGTPLPHHAPAIPARI